MKNIFTEENENFISASIPNDNFDSSKINANIYDDEIDSEKEEEKSKLKAEIVEKIKQNLKMSDELQSALNRMNKLNKDIQQNDWKVNEEDNTAVLKKKNARIFKQNNNICLSHDGKVEIFKSIKELHDWLRKNNYPLPHNISLHEAVITEDEKKKITYNDIEDSIREFLNYRNEREKERGETNFITFDDFDNNIKRFLNYFIHNEAGIDKEKSELKNINWILKNEDMTKEQKVQELAKIFRVEKIVNGSPESLKRLKEITAGHIEAYSNHIYQLEQAKKIKNMYDEYLESHKNSNKEKYQKSKKPEENSIVTDTPKEYVHKEDSKEYNFADDPYFLRRMKHRYENTRWGPILAHRWEKVGQIVDIKSPEQRQEDLYNASKKATYGNIRKMSREEEKEARFKADIKRVKNPFANEYEDKTEWNDLLQDRINRNLGIMSNDTIKIMKNDIRNYIKSGKDKFEKGKIKNHYSLSEDEFKELTKEIEKREKDMKDYIKSGKDKSKEEKIKNTYSLDDADFYELLRKLEKEDLKQESFEDNQLNTDNTWYLEYQTNIPDEKEYLNEFWRENNLLTDNLETAAKFVSREKAMDELRELYNFKSTAFPFKPVLGSEFNECGVGCGTTSSSLGSAVQYLGNKNQKESLDEDYELEEDRRQNVKDRARQNKELIQAAKVKDFNGNVIGIAGKKIIEYAEANNGEGELGFGIDENGNVVYQNHKLPEEILNRRIALDIYSNEPFGTINTEGKVRNFKGKEIGYSDTREASIQSGIDLDILGKNQEEDEKWQFDQKAPAHLRNDINRLSFYKKGKIVDKYQDAWNEITKNNEKLRKNPELLQTMFGGYHDKGKIIDPEAFKQRVLEINDTLGLNFKPNPLLLYPKKLSDKNSLDYDPESRAEYEKWRDTYYAPLFKASRRNAKETDKTYKDQEGYKNQRDEYYANITPKQQEDINQLIINDMNKSLELYNDGKIDMDKLDDTFDNVINKENVNDNLKRHLAKTTYDRISDYEGIGVANVFKKLHKDLFETNESVLTEEDSPEDFADNPSATIDDTMLSSNELDTNTDNSEMSIDGDSNDLDNLNDYEPEGQNGDIPDFGDININGGMGDFNLEGEEENPMPEENNKKIIDVLVNENDPSQIKLKIKNLDTGEIELKDLSEVNI